MKFFYIIFAILILTGCDSSRDQFNQISSLNTMYFNDDQIKDLEKIVDFFDEKICPDQTPENLKTCYTSFFENLYQKTLKGNMDLKFTNQEIIPYLSKSTFENIWICTEGSERSKIPTKGLSTRFEYLPRTFINYNPTGAYQNYLNDYATTTNDQILKEYVRHCKATEPGSPSAINLITSNYKSFNYTDETVRLLLAIHYLTLDYNLNPFDEANKCDAIPSSYQSKLLQKKRK